MTEKNNYHAILKYSDQLKSELQQQNLDDGKWVSTGHIKGDLVEVGFNGESLTFPDKYDLNKYYDKIAEIYENLELIGHINFGNEVLFYIIINDGDEYLKDIYIVNDTDEYFLTFGDMFVECMGYITPVTLKETGRFDEVISKASSGDVIRPMNADYYLDSGERVMFSKE